MDDLLAVRSFDSLEAAAAAVNELVRAGFQHGALELRVLETEPGPVGPDVPHENNFKQATSRTVYLVLVDAETPARKRTASAVLERSGGCAVQNLADTTLQRA